MRIYKTVSIIFTVIFFLNMLFTVNVSACKDIVACGDATEDDYNLLLKVRDPSRHGLQVLCIVPSGYEYEYNHPWTGKSMGFTTDHKFIGVATEDDIIPNIVKAGMTLTDAGLAFGDSDTNSGWNNPTRNAWDDFDWIRYACQKADSEDEAVELLTKDVVKEMHASGVSENLFVVGPNKGFVVEGDAFHYEIEEIVNGVAVRHNYPVMLWKTQHLKKRPISKSFDKVVEKSVRKMGVIRLGSLYGVKVTGIGDDYVTVTPVGIFHILKSKSIGVVTKIQLGEQVSVGEFSVKLIEIKEGKAKLSVCNVYKAWEDELMNHIQPRYGSINVCDMINWSRLSSEDLNGLRGMSQKNVEFESVAVYKIPKQNYKELSIGWFSPNNARSSIYVPFHVCNTDIFDPYKNGDAAQISLDLLQVYDDLSNKFNKTEDVFFYEIDSMEQISSDLLKNYKDVSEFLTIVDTGMQRQAYYTEELWMEASKHPSKQEIIDALTDLWENNYLFSLDKMQKTITSLKDISGSTSIIEKIEDIALDICKSRIDAATAIGKQSPTAEKYYKDGSELIRQGNYESGFEQIEKAFTECTMLIEGQSIEKPDTVSKENDETNLLLSIMVIIFVVVVLIALFFKKRG